MRVLRIAHHSVVSAWRERDRQLRAQGVDIGLLAAKRWNEGGQLVRLDPGEDTFVRGVATVGTNPNGFVFDPFPVWRALRAEPDLIDLHEEPVGIVTAQVLALRWLRRMRTPYILYSAQNIDRRYPIPFRWFERWALRGAAGAYVCNRDAGGILVRKGLRGPARLIPLGLDTAAFVPEERDGPDERPVIGYVGRLEPKKGVAVLLRAVATRPEWTLEITGDGPQKAELEALAADLGITDRVRFLGFAQDAELAARYRRLDAIAIPSLPRPTWLEQFCRVAVEAMASGVPVVASASGAIPDVVGEAGLLVEPDDVADLAARLGDALDADRWRELRARGLEHARDFTWEHVGRLHGDFYREVLSARDSGADTHPQVVVVAYGEPEMLEGSLDELGTGLPVTIVDNSSSARTRAVAERRGAHYIDPGRNLGFAAGVNVALRSLHARGLDAADVLLLNPDARITADTVSVLHRRLHSRRNIAAVGATQTDPATGAPARVWWPFPTPVRAWLDAFGLGRFDRSRNFAIGSVLLLRSEAVKEVGSFDERFFLYAEEVDWQKRARAAGWRIAVADVAATHVGAGTGGDSSRREAEFFASAERYQRKHYGSIGWTVFRLGVIVGATIRGCVGRGERAAAARRRRAIFVHGPVSHRGRS